MPDQLSCLAFYSSVIRKLGLGVAAACLMLVPFAAPLYAQAGFFAQSKSDGQNAGLFEATDYGLDQTRQAGKMSEHDYELAHQAEQRILSQFTSRHSGNPIFSYYEAATKAEIIANRQQYAVALYVAASQIQQEEAHLGVHSGVAVSKAGTTKTGGPGVPAIKEQQPSSLPGYLLGVLVLTIVGGAGYMFLGRRGAKPVAVSYVNVKAPPSDPPADREPPA